MSIYTQKKPSSVLQISPPEAWCVPLVRRFHEKARLFRDWLNLLPLSCGAGVGDHLGLMILR
ncbi:hypothetical protein, partial [Paracoccus sp. (in: a-proteobacteria)]|uniref:hypothetical protein n=1 Tax=Paracoccus sp. TaxID=267 RepID=UPI0026E09FC1